MSGLDGCAGDRVLRGGCYFNYTLIYLRVVNRFCSYPTIRDYFVGFRCVRPL